MNMPSGTEPNPAQPIDLAEVSRLLAQMQDDLGRVKNGSTSIDALREELDALARSLGAATQPVDQADLHHVRGLLQSATDTVEVDGIKAASYVAQIGRILGLT